MTPEEHMAAMDAWVALEPRHREMVASVLLDQYAGWKELADHQRARAFHALADRLDDNAASITLALKVLGFFEAPSKPSKVERLADDAAKYKLAYEKLQETTAELRARVAELEAVYAAALQSLCDAFHGGLVAIAEPSLLADVEAAVDSGNGLQWIEIEVGDDEPYRCVWCGRHVSHPDDADCDGDMQRHHDPLDAALSAILAARESAVTPAAVGMPWERLGWRWEERLGEWLLFQPGERHQRFVASVGRTGDTFVYDGAQEKARVGVVKPGGRDNAWNALCVRGWHGLTPADRTDAATPAPPSAPVGDVRCGVSGVARGLDSDWRNTDGLAWKYRYEHVSGASIARESECNPWMAFSPPTHMGVTIKRGSSDDALEAARLALGEPTQERREVAAIDWGAVRSPAENRLHFGPFSGEQQTDVVGAVMEALRAYHAELRRTGAIGGK